MQESIHQLARSWAGGSSSEQHAPPMDPMVLVDLVRLAVSRHQLWYLASVLSNPVTADLLRGAVPAHEFMEFQQAMLEYQQQQHSVPGHGSLVCFSLAGGVLASGLPVEEGVS